MSTKTQQKIAAVVLPALRAQRGQTAKELQVPKIQIDSLVEAGVVKVVGSRKHTNEQGEPSRGRPMHEFALTRKGQDRARRLVSA